MQKKWLEKTKPVPLSENKWMNDYVMEAQILKHQKGDVLEIDVYDNPGKRTLMCRHFMIKEKEYATFFPEKRKMKYRTYEKGWTDSKLDIVLSDGSYVYVYVGNDKIHISKKGILQINKYLNNEFETNMRVTWNHIVSEEDEISRKKAERALENKKNRIDNLMRSVEPVGKEFKDWAKRLFPEHYLFVENYKLKPGYRCHCSICQKNYYEKVKPKHNESVLCRKCKTPLMVKTRTYDINAEQSVIKMEKHENETLIRHFRITKHSFIFKKKAREVYRIDERIRMFRKNTGTKIYYHNGFSWNDNGWSDKKRGMIIDTWFYLYPEGIEDIQMKTGIKSALIQAAGAGKKMQYNNILRYTSFHERAEYMIKSRLYRLTSDAAEIFGAPGWMDEKADNIQDMLKLDKQRLNRLREMDGGKYALMALQYEKEHMEKISQENLEYIDMRRIQIEKLELESTGLTVNRMINYLRRQQEKEKKSIDTIMTYYRDYLHMAQERGGNLKDDIIRVNKRMVEFHDRYVEEATKKKDEKRAMEMEQKYDGIRKDYERNCELFQWQDEESIILIPRNVIDILEEGRRQHHCVGSSDVYIRAMHERKSYILFLRKKESADEPWYTLEVEENLTVKQKYAAYDRQPDIEKVNRILAKWKKEMKKRRNRIKINMPAAV